MAKDRLKMIVAGRFYSLGEIVRLKLIPGIDTVQKASNLMKNDLMFNNILKAVVIKRGANGMQYKVRGENIIRYLAQQDV